MKISAGLLGVALGQSGDTADYTYDYNEAAEKSDSYSYNAPTYNFNTGYDSNYSQNQGYNGGYYGRSTSNEAYPLSCWNSNSMRDMNHDNKFAAPGGDVIGDSGNNHQYGYENNYSAGTKFNSDNQEYGSDQDGVTGYNKYVDGQILNDHHIDITDANLSVDAVEPHKWGYQNNNPDAKYHYGHHVALDKTTGAKVGNNRGPTGPQPASSYHGFIADDWRYSLRHSGCLWEVKDFSYGAGTFDKQWTLAHTSHSGTPAAYVHWVHVFNAHIYPHGDKAVTSFKVVMANPVYEGLGYLNFVSTFADTKIGETDHDPFLSTYNGAARYSTYADVRDTSDPNVRTIHWTLTLTTASWKLQSLADKSGPDFGATETGHGLGVAISSFPHNQLGADFRFNVRTLHEFGHGFQDAIGDAAVNKADSYFWYGVDTITITFPHYVSAVDSCHHVRAGSDSDVSTSNLCLKHVHSIIIDENHVVTNVGTGRLTAGITDAEIEGAGECGGDYGPAATNHQCAEFCRRDDILCGKQLKIENIMSTYDEFHLRQYGTIQEIWAQLQYAYTHTVDSTSTTKTGFESPFPNVFFSAAQVESIALSCSGEKCTGYTRSENMPYAGNATLANRWLNDDMDTNNANGDEIYNGLSRGDAFWVNNNDNKPTVAP